MNPTLREGDLMELLPYAGQQPQVGDVIVFAPPTGGPNIVHRVVRSTVQGVHTRGDNNAFEDSYLLQPPDIQGQVVAAWRGQKRRQMASGRLGTLFGRWVRWRYRLDRRLADLLRPLYYVLAHRGWLGRLLPRGWRPRVVWFQRPEGVVPRVLLGQRQIGHWDVRLGRWNIRRPYRFLVDEASLPTMVGKPQP
jgi:hypothetical protein